MDDSKSLILHPHDDRSELQKLQSVIRKLQQIHTREELEFLCKVCKRDLLIPEQSEEGVTRGRAFVHKLLKHYRKTNTLSMGNQKVFDQILVDIGYPRDLDEIPPDISLEECCFEQSDEKTESEKQIL